MTNIQQYQITQSYKNPLRASMLQITQNKEANNVMTHEVTPESTCATLV